MVLRLKIKYLGLAKETQGLVVFLTAGEKILVRQVGKSKHNRGKLSFNLAKLIVDSLSFCRKLLHASKDLIYVLALLLILRNQLISSVLLSLYSLGFCDKISSFVIKSNYLLDFFLCVLSLFLKASDHLIGIFLDIFDV